MQTDEKPPEFIELQCNRYLEIMNKKKCKIKGQHVHRIKWK